MKKFKKGLKKIGKQVNKETKKFETKSFDWIHSVSNNDLEHFKTLAKNYGVEVKNHNGKEAFFIGSPAYMLSNGTEPVLTEWFYSKDYNKNVRVEQLKAALNLIGKISEYGFDNIKDEYLNLNFHGRAMLFYVAKCQNNINAEAFAKSVKDYATEGLNLDGDMFGECNGESEINFVKRTKNIHTAEAIFKHFYIPNDLLEIIEASNDNEEDNNNNNLNIVNEEQAQLEKAIAESLEDFKNKTNFENLNNDNLTNEEYEALPVYSDQYKFSDESQEVIGVSQEEIIDN